ncbi:hypothetical protein CRYPA_516 [uncultured Candidatus Thioglobus sp.]|nr:hypothetical protein CRYPA_516 [uncultured Candidatus Thioglobus sp.]
MIEKLFEVSLNSAANSCFNAKFRNFLKINNAYYFLDF